MEAFFIALERAWPACGGPFVWRPYPGTDTNTSVTYTNWAGGQPDCYWDLEYCAQIWPNYSWEWDDVECWSIGCPICQIDLLPSDTLV